MGPGRQKSIFIFPHRGAEGAVCPLANKNAIAVRHPQFTSVLFVGTAVYQFFEVSVFVFQGENIMDPKYP